MKIASIRTWLPFGDLESAGIDEWHGVFRSAILALPRGFYGTQGRQIVVFLLPYQSECGDQSQSGQGMRSGFKGLPQTYHALARVFPPSQRRQAKGGGYDPGRASVQSPQPSAQSVELAGVQGKGEKEKKTSTK